MSKIFILVPSLCPAGPVKGAIALANSLAARRSVTLVPVKPGPGADAPIDPAVAMLELYREGGWAARVNRLSDALQAAGGRASGDKGAVMISFCLSADATAFSLRQHARWIASVRGNLLRNYRFDYGLIGQAGAAVHLLTLRFADRVVAMTDPMAVQIARYTGRSPAVIGNFVDEAPFECWRRAASLSGPYRFVFLGSLSARKQPLALLEAVKQMKADGLEFRLDVIGEGPLRAQLQKAVGAMALESRVTLHGQLANPYELLAAADALVLPSLSEGVSRAVLEALHLGIPAVLRDVDGNGAIIDQGRTGILFNRDADLPTAMMAAARQRRQQTSSESLLPVAFRQMPCAEAFLNLAEAE